VAAALALCKGQVWPVLNSRTVWMLAPWRSLQPPARALVRAKRASRWASPASLLLVRTVPLPVRIQTLRSRVELRQEQRQCRQCSAND
jgi:hypothetical protein